jgi:hypothetical protein
MESSGLVTTVTRLSKGQRERRNKQAKKKGLLGPAAMQQVRNLLSIAQESKFFDSKAYAVAVSQTGVQYALSAIPQGSTDSTRDGDQINLKSIRIKMELYLQGIGGTNDFTNQIRVLLIRWIPMSTAAAPVPANILQDSASAAQSFTMSDYNWDLRRQFVVEMDKTFNLSGNGPSDLSFFFEKKWRTPGLPANFSAGSTTLQSNGLFLFVASDSILATHPVFNLYSRVEYADV